MEATKYAQSLIEALINDTDKKFEQQLPKMKPLQTASVAHGAGQKQKSASNAKLNGVASSAAKDDQTSKPSMKSGGVASSVVGAWQQPCLKSGNVAVTSGASAWSGDSTAAVRASPEMSKMSYSDRAKAIVIVSAAAESSSVSRSPPVDKMKMLSAATSVSGNSSGGGVQLAASGSGQRCEPQPLPIVTASGFPATPAAVSRLSASTSFMRDYSPFDNALSQIIAESVLTKRTDDFASVAAAGVVTSSPPLSVSYCEDATVSMPPPATASDPHKAPGYKMSACSDPTKAPGHRATKDAASYRGAQVPPISTSADGSGFRPSEYGRPSSTPNAAASSSLTADNSSGQTLGASLDRPASFFMSAGYRPYQVPPPPPPPGLMPMGPVATSDVYVLPASQFGGARNTGGGGAVTETSVLAAPLMATSLASASHPDATGHGFSIPPPVISTSAGNSFTYHAMRAPGPNAP